MLATKAARVVAAAAGRQVVDFASRRTHGLDAGLKFARASYLAGVRRHQQRLGRVQVRHPRGWNNGPLFHIHVRTARPMRSAATPVRSRTSSTFLVDTYDTLDGVRNAIKVAREMAARGSSLRAIRLDSGDMVALSRQAREMLDRADLNNVRILASSGLDEYSISDLVRSGAQIDGFGVGTRVGVSADAPYTDFVYKLVEYDGKPMMKLSEDKESLPGPQAGLQDRRH